MKLDKTKIYLKMCKLGITTRKELANKIGIAPNTLTNSFNNATVRIQTATKLAKALECEVQEIIQEE